MTFTKDVAPILQQKCQVCHQPNSIGPMSLHDLRRRPEVRAPDQDQGLRAADAAVAHRQDRRHPGVQERSQPERSRRSRRSSAGWTTARRWAIRRTCRRRRTFPDPTNGSSRRSIGKPDLVIKSPPYTLAARTQDKWFRPVTDTGLTEPRWVRAIEIKPSCAERPAHRAPRADDAAAGRGRHHRTRDSAHDAPDERRACSWSGRSARPARSSRRTRAS